MFTYICEHCGKKGLKPFGKRCAAIWRIAPYWFCNRACAKAEYENPKPDPIISALRSARESMRGQK